MALKIAVVGGGSTYTPELIEGFLNQRERLPIDELVLHDIDAERLRVVGDLACRMLERGGSRARLRCTLDRADAVEGADFVLVQIRVGGQQARLTDETLPLRFGCLGQETTGPGGFAKALRTVPVVLEIAEQVARLAPDAWLVDFTNPVGIVMQALLDERHRAIGLCNSALGFQRRVAEHLDVAPESVRIDHVGLNHLTWVRAVWIDGVNRLPQLLENSADVLVRESGVPETLIRALGAVPSYYLRYYYLSDVVLAEQLDSKRPRAQEVMEIERQLLEMYRDPTLAEKPRLLEQRGGAFYSEAAARLIASLHAGGDDVQVVDVRNEGALEDLPDDAVVEVPACVGRDGARALPHGELPAEMLALVQHAKAYERLTVQAAVSGDRRVALKALLSNPLVGRYEIAEPLLTAILDANRQYLPRFFPGG